MRDAKKRNELGPLAVLSGLWVVNILIVIFGSPFLIYKKLRELFARKTKKTLPAQAGQKSRRYFPCEINSKL